MFIRAGRLLSSAIVLLCFAATVFAQVPSAQHVVLVIDENSSYSAVINNVNGSAGKVVDLGQLNSDIQAGKLPRFSIIVPDGKHDAHDGSLAAADQFLNSTLSPILNLPDFKSGGTGLILVTFDE